MQCAALRRTECVAVGMRARVSQPRKQQGVFTSQCVAQSVAHTARTLAHAHAWSRSSSPFGYHC